MTAAAARIPDEFKLPCDVSLGRVHFMKGIPLRILVETADRWRADAVAAHQQNNRAMRILRLVRWALRCADEYDAENREERLDLCGHLLGCRQCRLSILDSVKRKWRMGVAI